MNLAGCLSFIIFIHLFTPSVYIYSVPTMGHLCMRHWRWTNESVGCGAYKH